MFAKAYANNSGRNLSNYMMTPKEGERVELAELRGFASDDIHEAFRSVDAMVLATKGTKPMFHVAVRNRDSEHLTDEQWLQVADRIESKLGLSGQPRGIVFHIDEKTGGRHMHVGWSRVDEETMRLKNLSFFKVRLKEVCREMEWKFGLEIVGNDRKGPGRAPKQYEEEQARRLGVDLKTVREKICECWQRSDDGKSFRAALQSEGLELLQGDRRRYVVMDQKGGIHALGQRVLGAKVGEINERLSDLNYEALSTVAQAQEKRRTGMRDQHAGDLAWEDALAAAAIAKEKATGRFAEPTGGLSLDDYERLPPLILDQVTRNRATFTGYDIARALKGEIDNELNRNGMARAILQHHDVVRIDAGQGRGARYTTTHVLQGEQHVLQSAQALSTHDWHDVPEGLVQGKSRGLAEEKARALAHMTERSGLVIIHGMAGTGKTTLLAAGKAVYEAHGYRVVAITHQNRAVEELREKGFLNARTIDSELWALAHGRTAWSARTVIMVDEAAMVDTRRLGMILAHAVEAGAKVVLTGDDRQLSSIERGGMFEVLRELYGAGVLSEVHRQQAADERQASQMMAQKNFTGALGIYAAKDAIHWADKRDAALEELVKKYSQDSAVAPDKTRFIIAYTNDEVNHLNAAIREARVARGELLDSSSFETKHGRAAFAEGDRLQFTATDKLRGIYNGQAGTVRVISGSRMTVDLDGREGRSVEFDSAHFEGFRHGYAGTIYKAQGRTIDQTYLLHSAHWRSTSAYVALTRHSHKTELFVARAVAKGLPELARQMSRIDERRAATHFMPLKIDANAKPLTPAQLAAWYANLDNYSREIRREQAESRQQSTERPAPTSRTTMDEIRFKFPVHEYRGSSPRIARTFIGVGGSLLSAIGALFGQDQPSPPGTPQEAETRRAMAEDRMKAALEAEKRRRYNREIETQARERGDRQR